MSSEFSPDDTDEAWEASVEDAFSDAVEPASAPVGTVPPGLVPAPVWRRAAAAALDAACSLLVVGLVAVVSEVLWVRSGGEVSAPVSALAALFVVAGWVHAFFGEAVSGGATLGKRALRLRVVSDGGEPPAVWRVVVRRLVLDAQALVVGALALWLTMVRQHGGLADGTPVALDRSDATVFLAFLSNLAVLVVLLRHFDSQCRFLHDRLAALRVVSPARAGGQAALRPGGAAGGCSGRPAVRRCGTTRRSAWWPRGRGRASSGGLIRWPQPRLQRGAGSARGVLRVWWIGSSGGPRGRSVPPPLACRAHRFRLPRRWASVPSPGWLRGPSTGSSRGGRVRSRGNRRALEARSRVVSSLCGLFPFPDQLVECARGLQHHDGVSGAEPDSGVLAVGWPVRDLTRTELLNETDLVEVDRELLGGAVYSGARVPFVDDSGDPVLAEAVDSQAAK